MSFSCFSSSAQHIFVHLTLMVCEVEGKCHTAAVLWGAASRILFKRAHSTSLCSYLM